MANNDNKEEEWISVSEMAQRMGVTKQTIYNYVKEQRFATKEFSRGSMRGLLIRVPTSITIT